LNATALGYYYKMGNFFINLLLEIEKDKKKFKLLVWLIILSIITANINDNLVYPVTELLFCWGAFDANAGNYREKYYNFTRVIQYFGFIGPYCISFFVMFIIRFFTKDN